MRESLPPAWAASLDSRPIEALPIGHEEETRKSKGEDEKRRRGEEEREVRKNGQWVHSRRAPVDRTTLQPGRRVSKAGLEGLRPLNTTTSPSPSPDGGNGHATTPGGDGRLGWV
ncbi:hypothetical protein P7C73_g6348, partial [Tremellales sp. Uapishka_1]